METMELIWFPTIPQVHIELAVFKRRSAQLLMIYGEEPFCTTMDEKSKYVQGVVLFCCHMVERPYASSVGDIIRSKGISFLFDNVQKVLGYFSLPATLSLRHRRS